MDAKLARGYAREFIQKQAHIPKGPAFYTDDFKAAISSSISIQKAKRLHELASEHMTKLSVINNRKAAYACPYFLPVGEYIEPALLFSLITIHTSLKNISGYEDFMFLRLNLHVVARLCERLNQKPDMNLLDSESLVKWVSLYQFAFSGLKGSIPIVIPHKNGLFLGRLNELQDDTDKMLTKYKITRNHFYRQYINSGFKVTERKPCSIQTFVSLDLLRPGQIEFRSELLKFRSASNELFNFCLLSALKQIWYKDVIDGQLSYFIQILEQNSSLIENSIHYLEKDTSEEELNEFDRKMNMMTSRYLKKLNVNQKPFTE